MGCFLSCLKADDDEGHLLPTSWHESRVVVSSRNPLSLFLSRAFKRKEDRSLPDRGNLGLGSLRDDGGLEKEPTFLEASDSSEGNPVEIWKASEKSEVLSHSKDSESLRFHSSLPNTSFEKLLPEVQASIPATPITFCQEWENGKDSLERTPWSSAYIAHDTQFGSRCSKDERTKQIHNTVHGTCENEMETNAASASPSPPLPTTAIQSRSKSLCFECETDLSSRGYKQSPYPTPLKISDEMQTPGTVYPATFLNQQNDNKPRARSQILCSDNYLAKNISLGEILEEESIHPEQDSDERKEEASLSWLKNASVVNEGRNSGKETSHNHIIPNLCESPADRPVLGIIDAHWNEEENPQIPSPKLWYVNGIPNTTNKYKDGQKVHWHATPFEERLEKALSDKSFISQRNHVCGKPSTLENEDNDTAPSQLQP